MQRQINTDLFSGFFGLAFAAFFWFSREGVGRLSIMFPNALLILAAVFSVALIIKGIVLAEHSQVFTEGNRVRIAVTAGSLFLWLLAIGNLGFYSASVVIFFFLVCYLASARQKLEPRRLILWLLIILGQVAFFDQIFARFLYVPLPRGLLF